MPFVISLVTAVSTHSRLKAAGSCYTARDIRHFVSTHSRLKAAGHFPFACFQPIGCFNTQPPEGGWVILAIWRCRLDVSTHSRLKAAGVILAIWRCRLDVSTHSRLKAAGPIKPNPNNIIKGFNTQPPEGGWCHSRNLEMPLGCFNTQPPEGGWDSHTRLFHRQRGFNTQPPEGGWFIRKTFERYNVEFQHTAA